MCTAPMYFYLDYQVALLVGLPVSTCVLSHPFVNLFLYFYLAADVIGVHRKSTKQHSTLVGRRLISEAVPPVEFGSQNKNT